MSGRPLLAATALLTRIPVGGAYDAADVGRSAAYFPLVGAGLGLLSAALAAGLTTLLPSRLTAVLIVAAGVWLTGAIHLDGLADTADGLGGDTREDALRIMREPTVGTFAVVAVVLLVACKAEALGALLERDAAVPYLVMAPALGRWAAVLLGRWCGYARASGGLGASVAGHVRRRDVLLATGFAAVASVLAGPVAAPASAALVLAVAVLVGTTSRRLLGGITGDVLGASTELSEAAVLVAAVAFTR